MLLNPDIAARLHAKLDKSGDCWLWTGYTDDKGYGIIMNLGKRVKVHRVMYALTHGEIPDGAFIDHKCFIHNCANPEHLRPATHKQNMENLQPVEGRVRGVYWDNRKQRWIARVGHNGKDCYVGTYTDLEAATKAVVAKRLELYTHCQD